MPPPAKVLADADVRLIVPVPVTVRLVDGSASHIVVPLPAIVQVPEPTAMLLTLEVSSALTPPVAPLMVTL